MKTISFTKDLGENALELSKQIGYDFKEFSITENIIHYLRIGAFVVKHYHVTDIGPGNCGKTYCLRNTSSRVCPIEKHTESHIFGSLTTGKGCINDDNDVAFSDESTNLISSSFTHSYNSNIKQYTNGDPITRDGFTTGKNCTSIYYAGNTLDEEQEKIDNSPYNYSGDSLNNLPTLFLEKPMKERIIIIPSFLSTKLCTYHYHTGEKPFTKEKFTSLLSEIREEHHNSIKIPFFDETRDVRKAQKIITALIKLIYPIDYTEDNVEELYEVSEFIVKLSYGKYTTFWNTDKGKRFILRLCVNYLPKNAIIQDCYFLENRILLKIKGEDIYYKIALTKYGINENLKEYKFFMDTNKKAILSKIYEKSASGVVLKQQYSPFLSSKNKFSDLNFFSYSSYFESKLDSLEKKIASLSEENRSLKESIEILINQNNKLLKYTIEVSMNPQAPNTLIPDFLSIPPKINPSNDLSLFKEKIKNELDIRKPITQESIGIVEGTQEYQLINFAHLIN